MKTARATAILLLMFIFAAVMPAMAMANVIGKVTAIQGDVDVLRPGMERAAPAVLQQPVSEGDIVRTKSNGKAEITFIDDSVIRLAPGSRLQLTEYLMEGGKRKSGVMNLFRGKVRAVVSKSRSFLGVAFGGGERFEVRTPTAVAGVKGTDFFVSYSMGVTSIMVTDGRVDVFNPAMPGQVVPVSAGNATFIAGDKPPSPPRPAADVEMIRHTHDTDTGEKPKEKKEEASTITASAGGPPAGGTFGYEAPEGTPPLPTDTGAIIETVEIPSSETHPELLSDIFAPVISIAGPSPYTNSSTASFTVTFDEPVTATYTMDTWGTTSTATTSDTFSIAGLTTEATWTLTVTATDAAGNISTQTYTWTTDYTPPLMTGVSGPASITNSPSAAFGFTANEAASSYSYSLDGGATWVSTGASLNLSGIPEGANIIQIRVTDLAGNTSLMSSSYSWTTDYTAPVSLTFSGTPPSITNINSATIGATATDANGVTYSYTLDGFASTGTLTGLTEGTHTFVATATDGAGNTSTISYSWTTDYTAPTVSITPQASSPELTGATAAVNISLGSSETAAYSYSLDNGATWVSTGASLNLSGVPEGANTIQITATDLAGNTSAPAALSFDLSRYSLSGTAVLTSSGVQDIGTATGEIAGISNQNWGGYNIDLSGSWWEGGSSTFTLIAGGTSTDTLTSNNGGYWLETITNAIDDGAGGFTGTSNLKYLSRDRLGVGTGTVNGDSSIWSTTYSGTYTETPLAWSGNINNYDDYYYGSLYTIDSFGISALGYDDSALLGGTSSPWAGTTSLSLLGPYYDYGANMYPYLWTPTFYSYNVNDGSYMTYDTGSGKGTFFGLIGGVWQNRTIAGHVYSLYIDPSGNAGILKGSLTGEYYPDISMYYADGIWTPIQLATLTPPSTGIGDLTYNADWDWNACGDCFTNSGSFAGGGYLITTDGEALWRQFSISGADWGIWQFMVGGGYATPISDIWEYTAEYSDISHISGIRIEGTQWSNDKIAGTTYGYGADITNTPQTWISVGETIGTFDANLLTWQAVQTGAWLSTTKFLDMIAAGDTAQLAALNIPFAEVGRANLSGSNTDWTINMNNVTFFAYQTGAAPKIWATGDVNGTYSCSACGATPALTGNGLSANLNMQTWDTVNNKWMATVNGGGTYTGTGTMNNTNVQMTGAAAGTNTGIGPGAFSGTGAGVAK